jgi:hypothetical protein
MTASFLSTLEKPVLQPKNQASEYDFDSFDSIALSAPSAGALLRQI